jgi:hypothetical protein
MKAANDVRAESAAYRSATEEQSATKPAAAPKAAEETEPPIVKAARDLIEAQDMQVPVGFDAAGNIRTRSAKEIFAKADADRVNAEEQRKAIETGANCFLCKAA